LPPLRRLPLPEPASRKLKTPELGEEPALHTKRPQPRV
jgi:hypothetical protein